MRPRPSQAITRAEKLHVPTGVCDSEARCVAHVDSLERESFPSYRTFR